MYLVFNCYIKLIIECLFHKSLLNLVLSIELLIVSSISQLMN